MAATIGCVENLAFFELLTDDRKRRTGGAGCAEERRMLDEFLNGTTWALMTEQ